MGSDLRQRDLAFANGPVRLAGSLTLPSGEGPCPGVVLVGGSGPTDRHNDVLFAPIRAHLVQAGIAVLSYDKRGVGELSGDWRDATIEQFASDAVAALDLLRGQQEVHAVALFGAATCRAGRTPRATFTVGIFPGADHRACLPDQAGFAPGYLQAISSWISEMGER